MDLSPIQRKFILHWGEMGTKWGINRTVAQVHALLYLSAEPVNAEEIAETLQVARSNVSTSIKELLGWGIIKNIHVLGDRRDHYESMTDVWTMFERILDERKRREWEPTLQMLAECMQEAESSNDESPHTRERIAAMQAFFTTMGAWYAQMRSLPKRTLFSFFSLGSNVKKFLGLKA
ncbi:MAG: MarR family transcriptional regulator [Verrucomicrobia bacterium]|nr:MarR family transcriptional regulator [Verrucomicrobiota bacterium]